MAILTGQTAKVLPKALLLWTSRDLGRKYLKLSKIAGNAKWRCTRSLAAIPSRRRTAAQLNRAARLPASKCGSSGGTTLPVLSTMSCRVSHVGHDASVPQAMASPTTIGKASLREPWWRYPFPKRGGISWRKSQQITTLAIPAESIHDPTARSPR